MEFETIIGLEVHVQVSTMSKMFCGCSAEYASAPPNTHVCPVCLGMPGVLPVINRDAVRKTIMTGLALGAEIPPYNKFDRKNYIYPDLMKGYQVSQYDLPMALGGHVDIVADGVSRRVGITRVHLEEDTARLTHTAGHEGDYSLVDVNRSGVPLMEIVTERTCVPRRRLASSSSRCGASSATSTLPARTWRRGSFAATRTSRSGRSMGLSSGRRSRSRT